MSSDLRLTEGQSSVWFGQAAHPGSGEFQCAELLVFDTPPDLDLLARTITDCLARIPVLQSEFTTDTAGTPVLRPRPHTYRVDRARVPDDVDPIDWCTARIDRPSRGTLHGDDLSGHTLLTLPGDPRDGAPDGEGEPAPTASTTNASPTTAWLARFHHIVGDGLAIGAVLRWIAACYTARAEGEDEPAPPLRTPEEALAADDAAHGGDESGRREHAAFWAAQDVPADPPTLGSPRVRGEEPRLVSVHASIPADTRAELRRLSSALGTHEMAVLYAISAHYVGALSGTGTGPSAAPISLGVPLMGRPLGERRLSVDPAVTVLPLVVPPRDTVAETVAEVHTRFDGVRRHGSYRAEWLRRDLGLTDPDRRLTGPNINYRPFGTRYTFGSATAHLTTLSVGPVHDIEFLFQSLDDGGLDLHAMADTTLHDRRSARAHADRLAGFVARTAAALAADPEVRWRDVPLLDGDESRVVVEEFNDTAHALRVPEGSTLTSLVRARRDADLADPARRDAPGLWFGGSELTWSEVWTEVELIAEALRDCGVGAGDLVALHLHRGPALSLSVAAVCAVGAAWVPLSPELPAARLETMLRRSAPKALVRWPRAALDLPAVLELDDTALRPSLGIGHAVRTAPFGGGAPDAADLAYVLFTSGSTGEPKAVAVPHAGIVNRLEWMSALYGLDHGQTLIQKTPCSFDVSVWEFLLPFTHGLRLAIAADGAHRDPARMADEIRDSATSFCHFVPSALKVFLEARPPALPSLRQVVVSGEALEPGLAAACLGALDVALHNLYGPTEASIDVTAHTCRGGDEVPIGAPVWNTRCYVLDDLGRPLPPRARGQLHLAGVQLASGYLGRPDLTAEKFVPDPFAAARHRGGRAGDGGDGAARMYATGDIASWREDGELLYHGRNDSQIKLRGQRLELGEIEAVVSETPGVAMCAVLARTLGGQTALVAFVVPRGDDVTDEEAEILAGRVRDVAASRLPEYMVPLVVTLESLPTTVNGKLDTRALPDPAEALPIERPATPLEEIVVAAFAEAVGADEVSVTANFFDLGGNSLSAVGLVAALSERLGLEVGIADLFAAKTARALAAALGSGSPGAAREAFAPLFALREHSSGIPVFCVHPAGGLGWAYSGLLRHLDAGRGVFAVQSPGLDGSGAPAESLRSAAARAADDIAARLDGLGADSADLVGWSVGGVVAQHAATVLADRGVTVRRLVLMDAYPAELWRGLPAPDEEARLEGLLTMAGIERKAVDDGARPLSTDLVRDAIRRRGGPFGSLPEEVLSGVIDMIGHNARLMREHATVPLDRPVHFLRAGRNPEAMDAEAWSPYVGPMDTITLDVTHPGLVSDDALREVAARLD